MSSNTIQPLTATRQKQLDLLLKLEQKKDGLGIELVYFNDIDKEKEQIAINEVGKMFYSKTKKDYEKEEEDFRNFIQSKTKSDTLDIIDGCLALTNKSEIDSIARIFSEHRNSRIKEYLFTMNDSTLIHTSIPNADAPKNLGSKPIFEVKYSMEGE